MKITSILSATLLLLMHAFPSSAATKEDILHLLPPVTPILIIDDSPAETISAVKSLTGTAQDQSGSDIDELFMLLGLEQAPGGIDLNGPAALAMPQVPFPLLVLSVTDYGLFLEGLRGGPAPEGSPPPVSPAPGIDALTLAGKPVFMRREGDLALLTPMALLLAQPQAGAGLSGTLHPGEKSILEGSGSFVRLDVAMLMAFLEPMLRQFIAGIESGLPPVPEGTELTEEQQAQAMARNVLKAEVELLLAGLRQVRSLSVGLAGDEKGSTLRSIWVPQPGSGFATLLAEPAETDARRLMRHFDAGAFFSGAFSMETSSFKGLVQNMMDFMFDSGVYTLSPEERAEWQALVDASFATTGDRSAFSMGPSATGGALSMLAIADVKDTEKMRTLMQDSLAVTEKLMVSSPVIEGGVRVKITPASETYRDVPIDRISIDIRPPEAKKDPAYDAYMKTMFGGPSLNLWFAFHDGRMIASYYSPTSEDLKKLLDRILDDVEGDLFASESFLEATGALPKQSGFFSYYSIPRMTEVFAGAVMSALPGEVPPLSFGLEKSSGFGSAWFSTGDALRTETFMPRAELDNYRVMIEYFKAVGKEKMQESEAPSPQ